MTQNKPHFFWFPYMTISSAECARLSLLFPRLLVLQAARPAVLPGCCASFVEGRPVLEDEKDRSVINAQLRGFQEFAVLHGEAGLQSSMVLEWIQHHAPENRLQIESTIKGPQGEKAAVDTRRLLMDAALFLEIARDLDEKEGDLQQDYLKMGALEEDFRNILGIEEGETDDALEAMNLSLEQEKSHLSVQLPKRMTSWLRLATPGLDGSFALVTRQREPVDEILDAAQTVCARRGEALQVEEMELASIPALQLPSSREVQGTYPDPGSLPESKAFHAAMEDLAMAAHIGGELTAHISRTREAGSSLATRIREIPSVHAADQLTLSLIQIRNCTLSDVWRHWDKEGQEACRTGPYAKGAFPPIFLVTACAQRKVG